MEETAKSDLERAAAFSRLMRESRRRRTATQ
jgi:hypothetical protein